MADELVRVQFNGDELEAVRDGDEVWIPFRRLCDALGLVMNSQLEKLRSRSWATVRQRRTVAEDGKKREVAAINLRTLGMWLGTIDENRVAERTKPKLIRYQAECADTIQRHFFGNQETTGDSVLDTLEREQKIIHALMENRQRQLVLERQQNQTQQMAAEAHALATAALCQSTMNHGYFTVVGYSNLHKREMPYSEAVLHGKALSKIHKDRGVAIGKMHDPRFGKVNSYSQKILREYFGDDE